MPSALGEVSKMFIGIGL